MKKIFLFLGAVAFACTLHAKTVTLDVANPTHPATISYDAAGVWTETYNDEDYLTIDFPSMSFSHLPSGDSWEGYFWDGFTFSKSTKTTYETMSDQFNCVAGGGLAGEGTPFLLGYAPEGWGPVSDCQAYFTDGNAWTAQEVYLCIGSWALENVLHGGGAARAFAAGDSLVIVIEGLDAERKVIEGKHVTFFLADYRSENAEDWKVNSGWEKCDLSSLGEVYGLVFTMKSSDSGSYGANTALYFALDGLKISRPVKGATFENEEGGINVAKADTCWQGANAPAMGWNNWKSDEYTFQTYSDGSGYYYSAFTVTNETANTSTGYLEPYRSASGGAYEGENFAVWNMNYYGADTVSFAAQVVPGFFVNNTAYAVTSMLNGDAFAKRFEKDDWLKLTITGLKDKAAGQSVDFYLAKDGKYVNQWTYVDLSELGEIDGVVFSMSSSDSGEWGMNTPAYFAMDNFGAELPEGYIEPARAEFPVVVEITITKEVRFTDAVKEEGWWQIIAQDDKYTVYICTKEGSVTEIAGTYTVDDLDEDYSGLEIEGLEDGVFFTEGSVTVTVDAETGDITVVGTLTGSDGIIYDLTLAYSDPKPEGTVDVKITDGALDDEYVDLGVYIVVGTDENGVTVQLALWLEEGAPFTGDYTEEDLDNLFFGSFVGVNEIEYDIFSATIKVVPGNKEGEYKLTADLLCYNNTLYKVEMLIPAKESGLSDINAATTVQKFIRDGQVLILRDGKTVNMHGVEVR